MEAKTPKGVKAWLELAKKTHLPILKASAKLLTRQIKDGASLADMTHTVERDPALCLHLFVAANRKNQNQDTEILTLNHVITLLGMQGVVNVVKQAPQMNLHDSDAFQKAYLQAQANSLFAGRLAEYWSDQMKIGSPERMKWATILAGAPQWLMWRIGYGPMRQCQWLVHHEYQPADQTEQGILGGVLEDIYRLLGRQLGLPNLAQKVLERAERPSLHQWGKMLSPRYLDYLDDDKELKFQKSHPVTLMSLMMYLSEQCLLGWMQRKALRAQLVLSHLTSQGLEAVVSKNHELAVNSSRAMVAHQVLVPAKSLLWPKPSNADRPWLRQPIRCVMSEMEREQPKPKKVAATPTAKPVEGTTLDTRNLVPQPPRQANKDLLVELINQFNKKVASFKDIHDILLTCNKAIFEGLGMRRTFICVLNKTGEVLRPLYCVGIEKESPVRALQIKIDQNRFFAKLLSQPASFKVDRDNYTQVKHMLHPDVVATLGNENFMSMSLFANGKPIGVVYADATTGEDLISEKEYQAFKKICQSATFALDSYAQKRRTG